MDPFRFTRRSNSGLEMGVLADTGIEVTAFRGCSDERIQRQRILHNALPKSFCGVLASHADAMYLESMRCGLIYWMDMSEDQFSDEYSTKRQSWAKFVRDRTCQAMCVLLPVLDLPEAHGDLSNSLFFRSRDNSPVLLAPKFTLLEDDEHEREERRKKDVHFICLFLVVASNRFGSVWFVEDCPELVFNDFGVHVLPCFQQYRDYLLSGEFEDPMEKRLALTPYFFNPNRLEVVQYVKDSHDFYFESRRVGKPLLDEAWEEVDDWINEVLALDNESLIKRYYFSLLLVHKQPAAASYEKGSCLLRFARSCLSHLSKTLGLEMEEWDVLELLDKELNFMWRLFCCNMFVYSRLNFMWQVFNCNVFAYSSLSNDDEYKHKMLRLLRQ